MEQQSDPERPCKTGSMGKSRRDGKRNTDIKVAIINLAMSVKTQSCGVSSSSTTVRKDKHPNKVHEINDQLRDLC